MSADTFLRMDRMYRRQRHIYDLSRKPYLLGRGRALAALEPAPGARICEVGCGTGRNLVALARRHREALFFGIDASGEMLKSARLKIERRGLSPRISLRRSLAEELDPAGTFALAQPFDAILFSYALSMMPDWQQALERALAALRPGGRLVVVDFSEARGLPSWFRALLGRWLALFEVRPSRGPAEHLAAIAEREGGRLAHSSLYRDYALLLIYRKPEGAPGAARVVDTSRVGG